MTTVLVNEDEPHIADVVPSQGPMRSRWRRVNRVESGTWLSTGTSHWLRGSRSRGAAAGVLSDGSEHLEELLVGGRTSQADLPTASRSPLICSKAGFASRQT